MHVFSFKNIYFVMSATWAQYHNKSKYYFILFLIIKYWWLLRMSSFVIGLWSNQKSNTVPFMEISLCLSFVKSLDRLLQQNLYHRLLFYVLNLEISVLSTYK